MSIILNKRILKEIETGSKSKLFTFKQYNNICQLKFLINEGIYIDQTHILEIIFTGQFPREAPKVKFLTPIFHPNIGLGGNICLDILDDKWSPMYNIETIFNSIIILLNDCNVDSPLNIDAKILFSKHNKKEYQKYCLNHYLTKIQTEEILNLLVD